jgi:FkbM family methyltransferase
MQPLARFRDDLLKQLPDPLLCIDVGARWGADIALLLLKERAKLLCFDPDEAECARLQALQPISEVEYVPLALSSDGRELQLTVTREPACSSIYEPLPVLYEHYPALEVIVPERAVTVPSTSLDEYLQGRELGKPDLLKLDTQGSELDILRGSINSLSAACMIDIEVEFNPIYRGQALFGDVDVFLRARGFSLWRLPLLVHYAPTNFPCAETPVQAVSTPPERREDANPGNGQLFWAQAHYVRTECLIADERRIAAPLARRAAVIASAYGYWDLALMVLAKCADTGHEAAALRNLLTAAQ